METPRILAEQRRSSIWFAVSLVFIIPAILIYKFLPAEAGGSHFAVCMALLGLGLISGLIASYYGKAGYGDELGAYLGLRRKGILLGHGDRSAILAGETEGLTVELKVYCDRSRSSELYGLSFSFSVRNPGRVCLAICDEGFFNRPVGFFPPEASRKPEWMAQRGLRLLAEPESALPGLLDKLALFSPFTLHNQHFIHLKGDTLEISMKRRTLEYGSEEIRELLDKAAKAAGLFN